MQQSLSMPTMEVDLCEVAKSYRDVNDAIRILAITATIDQHPDVLRGVERMKGRALDALNFGVELIQLRAKPVPPPSKSDPASECTPRHDMDWLTLLDEENEEPTRKALQRASKFLCSPQTGENAELQTNVENGKLAMTAIDNHARRLSKIGTLSAEVGMSLARVQRAVRECTKQMDLELARKLDGQS